MAQETVRVKGLRDLQRAFREYDKEAAQQLRDTLRDAGEAVRGDAASRLGSLSPVSAAGLKVRVRQRGVAVEQSKRKTTGLRPDWGTLQMSVALLPALDANEAETERRVENMLDSITRKTGF